MPVYTPVPLSEPATFLSRTPAHFQEGKADIEVGECQNGNQTVHVLELGAVRCEGRDGLSENIRIPIYFARLL